MWYSMVRGFRSKNILLEHEKYLVHMVLSGSASKGNASLKKQWLNSFNRGSPQSSPHKRLKKVHICYKLEVIKDLITQNKTFVCWEKKRKQMKNPKTL